MWYVMEAELKQQRDSEMWGGRGNIILGWGRAELWAGKWGVGSGRQS